MPRYIQFDPTASFTTTIAGLTGFAWKTSTNTSYYTYADNFTVQRSGSSAWGYAAISSATFSSGKYSFDLKVNSTPSGTKRTNFGIIKSGNESDGGSNWLSGGGWSSSQASGVQRESYSTNDYFTINVDFDSGALDILLNNSSVGTDSFTTGGNWHLAYQEYGYTAEFEAQNQIYAPPTGYTKITRTTGVPADVDDTRTYASVFDLRSQYKERAAGNWPT